MSYFKSKDVRVFPCSYRGNYEKNSGSVTFDPEARLSTESNLINAGGKLGLKESYLIEKTSGNVAKFVICGYYFEISNINSYDDELSNKRLFVKLTDKPIKDDDGTDRARSTKVLGSWEDGSASLDIPKDGEYYFTGLLIGDSATVGASGSLDISSEAAKLPSIDSSTGSKSIVVGKGNGNVASGENSLAGGNNSEASRKNSVAFGDNAIADKDNLVAIGKFNATTKDDDLFVVGNGTSAARSNVLQVNANKVNINKETNIAGNATVSGTEKVGGNFAVNENKFTVDSSNGNTSIAGTLSAGATTINGTESVNGNFSVNTDKFKVAADSGNTTVAGTIDISGKLTAEDNIETTKDISAAGVITTAGIKEDSKTLNISKNVNITGDEDENITGSLTVNSLTVNQNKLIVDSTKVYTSLPLEAKSFKTASLNVDGLIINENETNKWTALEIKKGTDEENKNLTVINANESKIVLENGMKSMLLNLFYPIGSIYTYLPNPDSEGNYPKISECPIAATLGGTWTQIKGRFLVAAGQEQDKENNSGLNLSAGDKGGSKDAVAVSHAHTAKSVEASSTTAAAYKDEWKDDTTKTLSGTLYTGRGEYSRWIHALEKGDGNGWDANKVIEVRNGYYTGTEYTDADPGFTMKEIQVRPNQDHKPDRLTFDFTHKHSVSIPELDVNVDSAGEDGKDKNMPPYLAVYMWKRVG